MAFLFDKIKKNKKKPHSQLSLTLWLLPRRSYRFDRDRQAVLGFICDKMYPHKELFT